MSLAALLTGTAGLCIILYGIWRLFAIMVPRGAQGVEDRVRGGRQEVYVIAYGASKAEAQSPIKIGIGNNPARRIRQLQTGNPNALTIYATFSVRDARRIEREAHKILAEYRMEGEWFAVSPEDAVTAVHMAMERPRAGIVPWFRRWRLRGT